MDMQLSAKIILFAPLVGVDPVRFRLAADRREGGDVADHADPVSGAAILSWYIFLTFQGDTQHITVLRFIESGTLSHRMGHPAGPDDGDHAGGGELGFGPRASLFPGLHGA